MKRLGVVLCIVIFTAGAASGAIVVTAPTFSVSNAGTSASFTVTVAFTGSYDVAGYDVDLKLTGRGGATGLAFTGASATPTNYVFSLPHAGFATQTSTSTELYGQDYLDTGTETLANVTKNLVTVSLAITPGTTGVFDVAVSRGDGFNDGNAVFGDQGSVNGVITVTAAEAIPPHVAITVPASGFACGQGMAPVALTAATTFGSNGTVTGVDFYDGVTKLGGATAGAGNTWTYSWTTSAAFLGTHSLTASATSATGIAAVSSPILVKVWMPGDSQGDGSVDGLDYNNWQNGYQQPSPTFATGDFNGDGSVDGLDYNVWQNNYNHTATYVGDMFVPMAAVPAAANAPHLVGMTPAAGATVADVTRLTLVFDSDVQVGEGAVEISGLKTGASRNLTQAYDAATRTLTLTWNRAIAADTYGVRVVADFVTAAGGGTPLDGEVGDPAAPTLPSGDGTPGGDTYVEISVK